jgi:hypothetical protein
VKIPPSVTIPLYKLLTQGFRLFHQNHPIFDHDPVGGKWLTSRSPKHISGAHIELSQV